MDQSVGLYPHQRSFGKRCPLIIERPLDEFIKDDDPGILNLFCTEKRIACRWVDGYLKNVQGQEDRKYLHEMVEKIVHGRRPLSSNKNSIVLWRTNVVRLDDFSWIQLHMSTEDGTRPRLVPVGRKLSERWHASGHLLLGQVTQRAAQLEFLFLSSGYCGSTNTERVDPFCRCRVRKQVSEDKEASLQYLTDVLLASSMNDVPSCFSQPDNLGTVCEYAGGSGEIWAVLWSLEVGE